MLALEGASTLSRVRAYEANKHMNLGNILLKLEHKDNSYKLVIK